MKQKTGVFPSSRRSWLMAALCAALVVTALTPGQGAARSRLENTQPLAGDPDVTDSPSPGPSKATKTARVIAPSSTTVASSATGSSRFPAWTEWFAYLRVLLRP